MSDPQKSQNKPILPPFFLIFDVESVGLHGEGFSFGYVVLSMETRAVVASGYVGCPIDAAEGYDDDREWVKANVPHREPNCQTPQEVREQFWALWMEWKQRGAALLADCAWPVEARFLITCVDHAMRVRNWDGPYPLYDLAPMLLLLGQDPLITVERLPEEMPQHDPLNDARQSARLLADCLAFLP